MPDIPVPTVISPGAALPRYATPGAAGADVVTPEHISLEPMERKLVRTGLRLAVPEGYELQVRPRSGLALRRGLGMVNSPGTIDSDYRGEVGVILINLSQERIDLEPGERIAQLVLCPVVRADFQPVDELAETERGEGGFGSTGTK